MSKRTHRIVFTVLVLVLIDQATKTLAHANRFEHTSVLPIGNPETALGLIQGSRQTLIVLTARDDRVRCLPCASQWPAAYRIGSPAS